jgi:hypothetical protein
MRMPTDASLLRGVWINSELAQRRGVSIQDRPDLSDDQLMRKLPMLTEMARPLLAKLPTVIDLTPGTPAEPQDAAVAVVPSDSHGLER